MHKLRFYAAFVGLTVMIMAVCDTLAFKVVSVNGYNFAASGIVYSFSFF